MSDGERRAKNTVVVSNKGVKTTIVDADDDDKPAANAVAKLDPPEKPARRTAPPVAPIKLGGRKTKQPPAEDDVMAREAQPTASGDRSLTRALGLKIGKIVIDPGHGGHDTGTIGPKGLRGERPGARRRPPPGQAADDAARVRKSSTPAAMTLSFRWKRARRLPTSSGADLFVSVHANSSRDPDARGVETYYLNFTSSPDALEVAARENAVSEKSIYELQDLVKKIALKEKIEESREFAGDVQKSLHAGLVGQEPRTAEPWRQEGSVHSVDRSQHALDSGGDFVCQQSWRRAQALAPANTASVSPNRSTAGSPSTSTV